MISPKPDNKAYETYASRKDKSSGSRIIGIAVWLLGMTDRIERLLGVGR